MSILFSGSRGPSAWLLGAAALLLLAAGGCARRAAEAPRAAAAPGPAQALRVYRDPSSGAFVEPPPGAAPAAPAPTAARAAAPAEEAAPGGGRMIRLNGAFRSQIVGRIDANTTTVSCTGAARAPGETTAAPR
jgi:hypothetical protein